MSILSDFSFKSQNLNLVLNLATQHFIENLPASLHVPFPKAGTNMFNMPYCLSQLSGKDSGTSSGHLIKANNRKILPLHLSLWFQYSLGTTCENLLESHFPDSVLKLSLHACSSATSQVLMGGSTKLRNSL